jgi:Lrp/AsnC family transcriptional regulator for asnA, asnC and gidA
MWFLLDDAGCYQARCSQSRSRPTRESVETKHNGNEILGPTVACRTICCEDRRVTRAPKAGPAIHLDHVSKAIIEQLQQDGRRSYAAIGKEVGLSEAAVRQRVQRLVESGVMQVVAVTDPMQLGFARQAMVGVRVRGALDPVADALVELTDVDYVVITAGTYDLLVEVVAESDEHLLEIISDRIRTIPGVEATETFMYLQLRKQTYSWGVR